MHLPAGQMQSRRRVSPGDGHKQRLRSCWLLHDPAKQLIDDIACLALPQRPGLALLGFIAFAKLKFGHRHGAVLAVALDRGVLCKATAQDGQRRLDHGAVPAPAFLAEGLGMSTAIEYEYSFEEEATQYGYTQRISFLPSGPRGGRA